MDSVVKSMKDIRIWERGKGGKRAKFWKVLSTGNIIMVKKEIFLNHLHVYKGNMASDGSTIINQMIKSKRL